MKPIRIVIAEDQAMVLGALVALLDLESDIEVVGSATDGKMAYQLVCDMRPDILITDIEMPQLTGLALALQLKEQKLKSKVIILTTFARQGYLRRALDAGVSGYLLKDTPSHELAKAIRNVHQGQRAIDPVLAMEAWSEEDPLTDRERDVLDLAGQGKSNVEIGEILHLADGTVRNYLSSAMQKMGAGNRVQASRLARQKGWL